ncbi:hypothetical protein ANO11243_002700 [Dothideomycetidae sp. 11243]|nr:hypothetical protein ANO11243_002700 [fungal sp. No.11243]
MFTLPSADGEPPDEPSIEGRRLAWDRDSAMAFRELADDEAVLLLTPAATAACAPRGSPQDKAADPFQPLGEAMSTIHGRIRHVPYLYWMGVTDIIYKWLDRIPTVVIVVCEPPAGVKTQQEVAKVMDRQRQFVHDAVSSYNYINQGTEPASIAVIYFGTQRYLPPEEIPICLQFCNYETVKLSSVARSLLK